MHSEPSVAITRRPSDGRPILILHLEVAAYLQRIRPIDEDRDPGPPVLAKRVRRETLLSYIAKCASERSEKVDSDAPGLGLDLIMLVLQPPGRRVRCVPQPVHPGTDEPDGSAGWGA